MSEIVSYTSDELAEMTLTTHLQMKALLQATAEMINTLADFQGPGSGNKVEQIFRNKIEELSLLHLSNEPKIDAALREKLKDQLGL